MLKKTVSAAALLAATFALSGTPASAHVVSGVAAANIEAGAGGAVQKVYYYGRRYGYGYGHRWHVITGADGLTPMAAIPAIMAGVEATPLGIGAVTPAAITATTAAIAATAGVRVWAAA